ncbi:MAG TPA: hypothetical protein VGH28_02475 [Polyangiaceae bacterium]|jgi:hypothetical protein
MRIAFSFACLFVLAPIACSDGGAVVTDAGVTDAAVEATVEAGEAMPAAPQVVDLGGPHFATPKIVPVFYGGDPNESDVESFLAALPASSYWAATTEYGVGALSVASSVVLGAAPSAASDADVRALIAAHTQGASADWPTDPEAIYAFFFPKTTTFTDDYGDTMCVGGNDGYHAATSSPYIVLAGCSDIGKGVLDTTTASLSHELVEASTDPFIGTTPSWAATDSDHLIWEAVPGGEVADMCELSPQSFDTIVGSYMVQRFWSNAAAAAGGDPCVPVSSAPYFIAAPVFPGETPVTQGTKKGKTLGIAVPVGQSATIDVVLHASAPTDPWTVTAADSSYFTGTTPELKLTLDRDTGNDGDVLHLTIQRLHPGSILGGTEIVLYSEHGTAIANAWAGFVGD